MKLEEDEQRPSGSDSIEERFRALKELERRLQDEDARAKRSRALEAKAAQSRIRIERFVGAASQTFDI